MLREISFRQFMELMEYDRLNPIGSLRDDWQAASICSVLMNIAAMKSGTEYRFSPNDFLLKFKDADEPVKPAPRKSTKELMAIARMHVIASNALEKKKNRKR